ncbi:MAG TPA: SDR family NAD(P)-dependent oxidoreductase [Azospirillaceae bacterium]|nr:SDR family NAD(P)-dependent oxidoreductase [Azospirillaceae bacterium]
MSRSPSGRLRTALIIGASSGIGEALARALARQGGWRLGLAARRTERLAAIAAELSPVPCVIRGLDLSAPDAARAETAALIEELGTVDLCIVCSGTGHFNEALDWGPERETITVNALGFAAVAGAALTHFFGRGEGHLVGISSISGLRGSGRAPAYAATKAFVSTYLDGLRALARAKAPRVRVTEAAPGFVATAMMKTDRPFWVASPEKAAQDILGAVARGAKHVYVTRRWGLMALWLRLLPRPG